MLVYFGSRERSVGDWTLLLREVDSRFKLKSHRAASRQANVIIVVTWEQEAVNGY